MLRSVRPTSPEDGPRIAELLADAGLNAPLSQAEMDWKYWQPRSDWPGPRSFVMTRGEEFLAHAGVVPGNCLSVGGRALTLHLIDWAARPDAVGAGVGLMKHIGRLADALLSIGGSEHTLSIIPHLGFRPLGTATGYVRPLRPLRILGGVQGSAWRLLPRTVRSVWWAARARPAGPVGRAVRVGAGEIGRLAADFPKPAPGAATFERSAALFEHVLACPMTRVELYAWESSARVRGYFLLAFTPAQARLADCWVSSADVEDWRSLVQCAVRQAREERDAAEIIAWASDPLLARVLRESGFHARGTYPIQLLARKNLVLRASSVRVQMLDNDAAYIHHGRADLSA